jgi:large repetitive protein
MRGRSVPTPTTARSRASVITHLNRELRRASRVVLALFIAATTALPFMPSPIALADVTNNNVAPGTSNTTNSSNGSPSGTKNTITPTVTPVTTPDNATSPVAMPSVPAGLVITPGDKKLTVRWNAADSSEKISGYAVSWSTDGQTWTSLPSARTSTNTSAVVEGLTNGVVVYVQVAAINSSGTSGSISSSGIPAAAASAPRGPASVTTPSSGTPYADSVRGDSPAGFWQFADTPSSTVANNGAAGTLTGVPSFGMPAPIGGMTAGYLQNKELTSNVDVSDVFSLEGWVNPSSINGDAATISRVGNSTNGSFLRVTAGGALQFVGFANGVVSKVESARGLVLSGTWSHVVATYANGQVVLYANGEQVASGTVAAAGGTYVIGASNDSGFAFGGSVANFAVYRSALTSSDVADHWSAANYRLGTGTTPSARPGDSFVILEWTAPASDGGSRILGYNIQVNTTAGWVDAIANTFSSSTSAFVTQLENGTRLANGTAYEFRVRAVTSVGAGTASDVVAVTPRGLASAPSNFDVVVPSAGRITLNWSAPSNNGGFAITGYRIEISNDGNSWRTYASASADTTTLSMTDVVTGSPFADEVYHFRVRAESSAGAGQSTVAIPVAPRRVTQPARSQAVNENNAEPTSAFAGEQSVLSAVAASIDTVARTYALGGVPGRVDSLVATSTNGGITITWATPTDTGTSAITSYVVQSSTDGAVWTNVTTSATSPHAIGSLVAGTQYMYRVYAVNAAGNGTPTTVLAVAGGNTAGNFASAPTGSNASAGTIPVSGTSNIDSYTSSVLVDNPTGFWKLSDASGATSATDSGSAGANGVPASVTFGGASNFSPLATSQLAASFNGTSSKIVVPDNAAWQSNAITAEAWIKPGATQTTNFASPLSRNTTNGTGWWIEVTNAGQLFASVNGVHLYSASGVIVPSRWQHIAMTFDGSIIKLYVNGVVVSTVAAPNMELQTLGTPLQIGARNATAVNFFNGLVSNVAVYGTALGDARIQNHVQAGGLAANAVSAPTVVAGDGTATLTWTAPTYSNGTITGYEIQTAPVIGGGAAGNVSVWTTVATSTATSSTVSHTLAASGGVSFRVRAISSSGAGQWSIPVQTTVFGTPVLPSGLTAATTSNNQVTLTWVAPTRTSSGIAIETITGYRIESSTNGGTSWSSITPSTGSTALTYVVDGVTNGVSRLFRVAALTASTTGAFASVSITPGVIASSPRNLTATGTGDGTIALSWTAPLNTGGSPVLNYILDYCTTAGCTPSIVIDSGVPASATSYAVSGMLNQQGGITFRLRAVTAAGTGDGATVVGRTAPQVSAPNALTGVAEVAWEGLSNQAYLTWSAPTLLYGQTVVGYQYEKSSDGGTTWIVLNNLLTNSTTPYIQGLSAGVTYQFRVAARTSQGLGLYNYVSVTPTGSATYTGSIATAPLNLRATVDGPATVLLTWAAPTYTGGLPLLGYRIRYLATNDPTAATSGAIDALAPAGTTQFRLNGLPTGSNYFVRVTPVTAVGEGDYAAVGFIQYDTPSAPRTLTSAPSDGTIALTWTAPGTTGGYSVYGYRVEQSSDGVNWTVLTLDTSTTSFTARGINNGTTYQFRVAAVTAIGFGDYASIVATPFTVPNAPLNVIAAPGNEQVTLNWTAPANNGNTIIHYIVESSTDYGTNWSEVGRVVGATNTTFTHTGLFNGGQHGIMYYYLYRVTAVNGAGPGAVSTTAHTAPGNTPSNVTSLTTAVYSTMVQLNWACCLGDANKGPFYGGPSSPVIAFRIEQSTDGGASWQFLHDRPVAYLWTRISALRNGVTYQFRVSAINAFGVGTPTIISATPSSTPDSPTNMAVTTNATGTSATATVTWAAPVTDGGLPLTGYRVRWCATANCNPTTVLSDVLSPTTFSYVVSGLTTGTTYNISVEAQNANGYSPNQNTDSCVPGWSSKRCHNIEYIGGEHRDGDKPGWNHWYCDVPHGDVGRSECH